MPTIDTLHNRALRACGAAADRCLLAGSARLATLAEQAHQLAERAFKRQDVDCLRRIIATARAIGRRVRIGASQRGES